MGIYANRFKSAMYSLFDRAFIPPELAATRGPLILHMSDTPAEIYPFLYQLVTLIKPAHILHTGDVADNYKIEKQNSQLSQYQQSVVPFLNQLVKISGAQLHVSPGNHDDLPTLMKLFPGEALKDRTIQLYGKRFHLMHILENQREEPGYYCFGHQFQPASREEDTRILLNGLLHIHVIDVETWQVYHLEYPPGTNKFRKMDRNPTGL
ncbi:metallophosphoesterase [Anoxynatronum buryatiense]|uniref:Calcineurin-like phosphoesterase n=1 Tax=Anoxynatronum buryatiense TaxID=489973 RepID=A0AA46AK56_9CLOT|nr:metallophosphoesterase [Anoxynatronum buryatiense]SMP66428.1 Calcineurin-like phosphoesterase [Anoxynatronum buryatiense]